MAELQIWNVDMRSLLNPARQVKPGQLTAQEREQYEADKAAIRQGMETLQAAFLSIGETLRRVRDAKSYRQDHSSFEEFCQKEFGWTRQRGAQMISATKAVEPLPPELKAKVSTESQARELSKMPMPKRIEVLQSIGGNVTAKKIKEAATVSDDGDKLKDAHGLLVPDEILERWHEAETAIADLVRNLRAIQGELKSRENNRGFLGVSFQSNDIRIDEVIKDLMNQKPYALCPSCNGVTFEDCDTCQEKGFLGKGRWGQVPTEIREMLENHRKSEAQNGDA